MPLEIKIVLFGHSGIGKTSITKRAESGRFDGTTQPTLGGQNQFDYDFAI
jgi:GTPase SAR1 family protein